MIIGYLESLLLSSFNGFQITCFEIKSSKIFDKLFERLKFGRQQIEFTVLRDGAHYQGVV